MSKIKTFGFDTLSLHAGQRPDPTTGARATPIYQTASYVFKSPDHAASLFNAERAGHVYSSESLTRPLQSLRSASPHLKAALVPSPQPVVRRPVTWPLPHCLAPATT